MLLPPLAAGGGQHGDDASTRGDVWTHCPSYQVRLMKYGNSISDDPYPILLYRFEEEEEAISVANATPFGLASMYT